MPVPVDKFGKDHWSLLAYVETRVVDYTVSSDVGELDRNHLRWNKNKYSLLAGRHSAWDSAWGTHLRSIGKRDPEILSDHDDWDCLQDLEAAGFVEILSMVNAYVCLPPEGYIAAKKLREHKGAGGTFSDFHL